MAKKKNTFLKLILHLIYRGSKPGRLNPVRVKNLMGFENRQETGAGFAKPSKPAPVFEICRFRLKYYNRQLFFAITGFCRLPVFAGFAGLSQTGRDFKPAPVSTCYETLEKVLFLLN